jgi:hypothetical protein
MAKYRILVIGPGRRAVAETTITATRNFDAVETAQRLAEAHNYSGYEVWRGERMIVRRLWRFQPMPRPRSPAGS